MRCSTRSRYGLRFLLRLACEESGEAVTLREIAEEEGISQGYLEQIVHALRPLGLLRAARGAGGGYILAKDPAAIHLDTVFTCLEGELLSLDCLHSEEACQRRPSCTTHIFWFDFERAIRSYLRTITLKTLLDAQRHFLEDITMWDYTQAVHDHFLHPHNAGPLKDANAVGEVGSLACGDALRLYLKISPDGVIEKAGFETFGCASAIASSSVLTDIVIGMHVDEALKLTNKDIVEKLGGLPREKMHCSVMGQEALEAAVRNWRGEAPIPHAQEIGKLVCKCFGVTDAQIIRTIRENGLTTVDEVTDYTKAGGACGECRDEIAEILAAELNKKSEGQKNKGKSTLTNVQRMQAVLAVLQGDAKKALTPGEEVSLVDVDGLRVTLAFTSKRTEELKKTLETLLRSSVEDGIVVLEG